MISETPFDESHSDGISRRRVLKRIGTGAAIAWTAPILTSIRTPAFAQPYGCDCAPYNCQAPELCDNGCLCTTRHGGGPCICWSSGGCFVCETDADCPAGFVCGDVGPGCACSGNTACFSEAGCTGSMRTGPIKGWRKR